MISDDRLPAALLLGPSSAVDFAGSAVSADGGTIRSLRANQVLYRPGRSICVRYSAKVRWRGGRESDEVLVVAAGDKKPREAIVIERNGVSVAVWRFPNDPALLGLAKAFDPSWSKALLQQLGVPAVGATVSLRAYRPGRRAVLALDTEVGLRGRVRRSPSRRLFLKVLEPDAAPELARRHSLLQGRVPVAGCLHSSSETGIVVLESLPGERLSDYLLGGGSAAPDGARLIRLLEELDDVPLPAGQHKPAVQRALGHVDFISSVLPEHADRVARFIVRLGDHAPQPAANVHGDFHESQVLVGDEGISGLLDVDDAGGGERIDDLALMLGRLWTLAKTHPTAPAGVNDYVNGLYKEFSRVAGQPELRRRVAVAVLGRARGPFRNQFKDWPVETLRRVELAERWLEPGAEIPQ